MERQRAGRNLKIGARQRLQPGVVVLLVCAVDIRLRKRSPEQWRKARVAFDDNVQRTFQYIGRAGGKHDFVAEALLRVNQDALVRERLAAPLRERETARRGAGRREA